MPTKKQSRKNTDEEIDEMRDSEGNPPKQVHDWLSRIGKKGRATPPKNQ